MVVVGSSGGGCRGGNCGGGGGINVVVVVVAAVELVFTVRYRGLCCSKMSARLPFRLSHISIMSKRLDIILIFFTIGQPHHSIAFIARHHTDVRY